MQLPPPAVLATWPLPNYVDPVTRGGSVLIVSVATLAAAFLVTCLRLFTRYRITCTPGFDDVLIVVALAFAIGMCVVTCMATENWGWNRHIWDIPMSWLPTVQKLNLSFQVLFSVSSSVTKLSILWFCKRLLGAGSKGLYRTYYIVLIAAMVFVAICCILFEGISIFQCRPIRAYWELEPQYPHTCLNDGIAVFSASLVNILTDFMATVIPMPLIWNLKLPTRQRIAVMSIFGLGIVVNVAGSIRTAYVYESMIASYDATWMGWPILLSAPIEINLGLICASAPALRPLLAFIVPHLLQTTRNYANSSSKRASKFWSPGLSKNSNPVTSQAQPDLEAQGDRLEVLRTIEMETWSEEKGKTTNVLRSDMYDVTSSHTRAPSALDKVDLKSGDVVHHQYHRSLPSSSSGSATMIGGSQPRSPIGAAF